ncbi:unnamed protein product [Penicillium salamii]|uniref:Uncharacterized protein n=1 Tax=Penicillium salamii TaxID=1612424 RepID=A0A9W4IZW3_9EURO|nr:unnamed protein product [Penicillium salamii]CAG8315711.1 unnamed protein product [Penicillium salamii]CAG8342779.1 unnamed protein product [Penicillium salamii]CAG8364774.1 unnamed protein product [Penicillium salamii]CAG8374406.1 unnamed protein product [Penicillium salamii]
MFNRRNCSRPWEVAPSPLPPLPLHGVRRSLQRRPQSQMASLSSQWVCGKLRRFPAYLRDF